MINNKSSEDEDYGDYAWLELPMSIPSCSKWILMQIAGEKGWIWRCKREFVVLDIKYDADFGQNIRRYFGSNDMFFLMI